MTIMLIGNKSDLTVNTPDSATPWYQETTLSAVIRLPGYAELAHIARRELHLLARMCEAALSEARQSLSEATNHDSPCSIGAL